MQSLLILADIDDILKVIIPIIFVVMSGLSQLAANREKGKRPKVKPAPRPAPGAGPAGPPQDALRKEVEDFLRKARGGGEQPAKPRPAVGQQRPAQTRPGSGRDAPQPARPPLRAPLGSDKPQRDRSQRPAARRPAQPQQQPQHETVADHVRTHIGSHPVTEHSTHLAESIGLADERMEEHLREKFSHKLGSLEQSVEAIQAEAPSPMIAELIGTLTRPGGARQLILANEILRRPEERWSRGK